MVLGWCQVCSVTFPRLLIPYILWINLNILYNIRMGWIHIVNINTYTTFFGNFKTNYVTSELIKLLYIDDANKALWLAVNATARFLPFSLFIRLSFCLRIASNNNWHFTLDQLNLLNATKSFFVEISWNFHFQSILNRSYKIKILKTFRSLSINFKVVFLKLKLD